MSKTTPTFRPCQKGSSLGNRTWYCGSLSRSTCTQVKSVGGKHGLFWPNWYNKLLTRSRWTRFTVHVCGCGHIRLPSVLLCAWREPSCSAQWSGMWDWLDPVTSHGQSSWKQVISVHRPIGASLTVSPLGKDLLISSIWRSDYSKQTLFKWPNGNVTTV